MPTEVREIFFTNTEVMRGITILKRSRGEPLPPGSIVDIKLETNSDTPFTAALATDGEGRMTIQPHRNELAAALLIFCRDSGIPVPVKARKLVDVKNGKVVLRIEID